MPPSHSPPTLVPTMTFNDTATDQELLRAFLQQRAQEAFALLMRRHGAMVWSVCRRMLGHVQDAEDAFQAVFLVLVRKAASLGHQTNLGPWLYGVAYRTALKQRAVQIKRLARERQAELRSEPTPPIPAEALTALDEEIQRLPERYRQPLVLCLLEGQTREQAATGLRLAPGTLSSRIAWAKQLLAQRLTRRGVTLSLAALAAALAPSAAPAACVETATQQAITVASTGNMAGTGVSAPVAALTQEVLTAMWYKQLSKVAAIFLSLAALSAVVVWLALAVQAGDDPNAPSDQERIVGEWKALSVTDGGRRRDIQGGLIFTKDKFTLVAEGKDKKEFPYRLDPSKKPKWLDSKNGDGTKDILGIYKFEGKRLIICINEVGDGPRPDRFISEGGTPNDLLIELERAK